MTIIMSIRLYYVLSVYSRYCQHQVPCRLGFHLASGLGTNDEFCLLEAGISCIDLIHLSSDPQAAWVYVLRKSRS